MTAVLDQLDQLDHAAEHRQRVATWHDAPHRRDGVPAAYPPAPDWPGVRVEHWDPDQAVYRKRWVLDQLEQTDPRVVVEAHRLDCATADGEIPTMGELYVTLALESGHHDPMGTGDIMLDLDGARRLVQVLSELLDPSTHRG